MNVTDVKNWPWETFTARQIACRDGTILIDSDALTALERLFKKFGKCQINSAYRSPEYNAKIEGAKNSQHCLGRAFDLAIDLERHKRLQEAARSVGFTGFGHYKTFLHCDIGPKREWWNGIRRSDIDNQQKGK